MRIRSFRRGLVVCLPVGWLLESAQRSANHR